MKTRDVARGSALLFLSESRASAFWRHAFAITGSITPHVLPNVFLVGAIASLICFVSWLAEELTHVRLELAVAPYDLGAALGLIVVLRTKAGYDRWWEARKLWGGIVNQCRNLAISARV